jgi:hypothetical protein
MDAAIVENKDAVFSWVLVHHRQKAFKPQQELVAIVASSFDMTVNNTVGSDCGEERVAAKGVSGILRL